MKLRLLFIMMIVTIFGCATYFEKICNESDVADKRIQIVKATCIPVASAIPGDIIVGTKACNKAVDLVMNGLDLGCILSPQDSKEQDPD